MMRAMPNKLLANLDDDQRAVVTTLSGPICVLAGAGTGKTRAITHRIAYGVHTGKYQPMSILAVTFTARAAAEMRGRLRALGAPGVQARTFHSAALRQLSYFWPRIIGGPLPRLMEHKAQLVAGVARQLGVEIDRLLVRDIAAEIEWAKVTMVCAQDYPSVAASLGRPAPADLDHLTISRIITAYEDATRERGVIDFEDVLLHMGAILAEHPQVARQVRGQYRHFVVDEYQDVSPLQHFLLDQWLGDSQEVCVVGDPHQTIYSFAGASADYVRNFSRRFPNAETFVLNQDYRSTPQVVDLANRVIAAGRSRVEQRLVAMRPPGPPVSFAVYEDDEAEASAIATKISNLIASGVTAASIAILYRTNVQSEAFETALTEAGVGFQVRGGERFFSRPEIRQVMALMRGASRVVDTNLTMPEQVADLATGVGWTPKPPAGRGAVRERWDGLQAIVTLAQEMFATDPQSQLDALLADLDERAAVQHAPLVDGVMLATLHTAKGLEWDAVFLAGLCEGLLPISMADSPEAIAEERRLLYVGITRARKHLHLSYSRSRSGRGKRKVSRFLDSVWPGGKPPAAGRSKSVQHLGGDVDVELFEALRQWRLALATQLERPAYTVLVDQSLAEIAQLQPKTLTDLGRVRGIGPVKIGNFGAEILEIVAAHLARQE